MTVKTNRRDRKPFWGCTDYPRCSHTVAIDLAKYTKWCLENGRFPHIKVRSDRTAPDIKAWSIAMNRTRFAPVKAQRMKAKIKLPTQRDFD